MKIGYIGAACLAGVMSAPSVAAVYVATFTSTIAGGFDHTGIFIPRGSLAGQPVVVSYRYDTAIGALTSSPGVNQLSGGVRYGLPNSISAVTITIAGTTYTASSSYESLLRATAPTSTSVNGQFYILSDRSTAGLSGRDYVQFSAASPLITSSLSQIGAYPLTGIQATVYLSNDQGPTAEIYGVTGPSTLTLTPATAIPEPATWALMIGGFGLTGGMMRRHAGGGALPRGPMRIAGAGGLRVAAVVGGRSHRTC